MSSEARGQAKAEGEQDKYFGADTCKICHEKPQAQFQTDHVLLTEWATWKNQDKHAQAYAVLTGERSQRMGQLLGLDPVKDARCLNCHAMNFPKERQGDAFQLKDGVTCDGCHGPAEKWLTPHWQRAWRDKPVEEKTKLGMIDMRDPARRAAMCSSCHIGNTEEGKVLTHAMYAAGHPPLPGFELDTFSVSLPHHWRWLKDKPAAVQEKFGHKPGQLERVRSVTIGGVVTLRESAKLLATQVKKEPWPDFAQFDCASCHHDLRRPSWRQARENPGVPGRPLAPRWSSALVRLGITAAADNDTEAKKLHGQFQQLTRQLAEAYAAQPFGDDAKVVAAARALEAFADTLIDKLRGRSFDKNVARRLLDQLAAIVREDMPDADSARQVAWAYRTIYAQLEPVPQRDADIRALLDAIAKELDLNLPAGKEKQIEQALPERFEAQRRYDPARLLRQFDDMSRLLADR